MFDSITIEKDAIFFGNEKVCLPFTREKVDAILGTPRIEEEDFSFSNGTSFHRKSYNWDSLGIYCTMENLKDQYDHFVISVAKSPLAADADKPYFTGKVMIGKKEYKDAGFKLDEYESLYVKRVGPFEVSTYLPDKVEESDDPEMARIYSTDVEILYHAPRPKTSVYDLKKAEEAVLQFASFPFKLLVMEELMYRQEVLKPKFDIYDFAEKNTKREIDVEDEGYEPIPDAKKWFSNYEIPARDAENITELLWDGGLEVYHQIWPFWDGEDDSFNVKKLSEEDNGVAVLIEDGEVTEVGYKDITF